MIAEDAGAWRIAATAVVVAAAAALVGVGLSAVLRWLLRRLGVTVTNGRAGRAPTIMICVLGAMVLYNRALDRRWADAVAAVLDLALTAAIAWLAVVVAMTVERAALAKFPENLEDLRARHVRTQITLIRRIVVSLIVLVALGAILWTFPIVRELGVSLFASAGVLGIVAGLAAQTTLGNVFAGMQIAFTDAIRVGDVVVIDREWGTIETITLTYVAVRVWNGTTLILPSTYFTTTPFRNWTHAGAQIVGEVDVTADWTVDVPAARAELERIVAASEYWDGRQARLVVQDTTDTHVVLRCLVSATRSDTVAFLVWEVREGLLAYLQGRPGSMPHGHYRLIQQETTPQPK